MDIDPLVKSLILDFLLRQSLEPALISMIRALSPSDDEFSLMKLFLLKKLETGVSGYPVSVKTLEVLKNLGEVEFQLGNEGVSDSMKRAFCAVAVECTVKHLKRGDRVGFLEAVKSIWKGKIEGMKEGANGGLGSEELWAWKEEIEAAAAAEEEEEEFVDRVVEKSGGVNVVESVNAYVKEEREKMGPSFLELLAERLKNGVTLQEILGVGADKKAGGSSNADEKGDRNGKRKVRENRLNDATSGNTRNGDPNERKANGASQPGKSGEARGSGPKAVKNAKRQRQTKDKNATSGSSSSTRARGRGESTNRSQERRGVNLKMRRTTRRWSLEEEEIFRMEVQKYGKGSWKFILDLHRDIFSHRTGADLKDKYRNLMRPQQQAQPSAQML